MIGLKQNWKTKEGLRIITIKLLGGDEVVCRLDSHTTDHLRIIKPLVVMMQQQGFGLMPFMLTGDPDEALEIPTNVVVGVTLTNKAVADHYMQQTSGLTIPT
jgi:hypothetical protein